MALAHIWSPSRTARILLSVAFVLSLSLGCAESTPEPISTASRQDTSDSHVEFQLDQQTGRLTVSNLPPDTAEAPLNQRLTVRVDREDAPAMLGSVESIDQTLVFHPEFPFDSGQAYVAEFHAGSDTARPHVFRFTIPPEEFVPTRVLQIYPTSDRLPENQLKFYLHFSAPMSVGEVYQHVHLVDASGTKIEAPFLELGEELWDRSGTRFTLFIDPGRIKRGLKPREELGPALLEGGRYVLTVDTDWHDAHGQPLAAPHTKAFELTAPDATQPNADKWSLAVPDAGTTDPLIVTFDEPLDHAMLQRVIEVADKHDAPVAGEIVTSHQETQWHFKPDDPWSAGEYSLNVETLLEDLAGNSLAKPFEVDLQGGTRPDVPRIFRRRFGVKPGP